jgi:cell division septal protein FtsQ
MFPGTLAVVVVEREPMGVGRINGALYLIDETGTVIDEFGPNYADLDLPIVDGLTSKGGDHDAVDEARAALAGRLMVDLQRRPGLAEQVSQIDVTDAHNAAVILKGDTALLRVGDERFAERVQSYLDLMPALREQMPDLDYVDLRFGERVYVRPQPQARNRRASGEARGRASSASAEQARGASGAAAEQSGSRAPAGQADSTGKRPRAERRSGG